MNGKEIFESAVLVLISMALILAVCAELIDNEIRALWSIFTANMLFQALIVKKIAELEKKINGQAKKSDTR